MESEQKLKELRQELGLTLRKIGEKVTTCPCCNRLAECTHEFENQFYCSDNCVKEHMVFVNQVTTICKVTGLTPIEVKKTMSVNNWSLYDFTQSIDYCLDELSSDSSIPFAIGTAFKNAGVYNTLSKNLALLNTNRGGTNFKGFVFEHLHATNATVSRTPTTVIADNGIADFIIVQKDGTKVLGQAKAGYQNTGIDFQKYKGQTIVVDKGNTQLIKRAQATGLDVIESDISLKQCKSLSNIMKLESQILRTSNASLTSKLYALNQAGVASAKVGSAAGAGFSIGSNIVDVFSGDKNLNEATKAVARDTAIATASSYAIGVAAATPLGTAISGTVASTGAAIAGTSVGGAVVAGAGALTGLVTTATTAVTGAVASSAVGVGVASAATAVTTAATGAVTAVAGTAVGTAVTGLATAAAGTTVGAAAVAGATAIGAAAVAAAPVVAVAAVAGGLFALGKKIFGK
ncbi:hypothetical protein [Paenibacillus sp. URB8-2]|uniref:hypothetical protein n=1 Tax=Paenibacillus sp. URB8-2 TaxID=2741301 RepID=UPI0015B92F3A|nr:hypothetical protein [Paenibacillus sp. URB8-2]BCG58757.1 hypothetical protein PUR_21820 [Paenibacillus sp. URB8-2]